MSIKIILITGSHLSSNPRLVKEAKAFIDAGYSLEILCAQNLIYLTKFDEEIFKSLSNAKIKIINYERNSLKNWYIRLLSGLRLKLHGLRIFKNWGYLKWIDQSRVLPEMKIALKNMKADLYIAHTLAGLPAAAWAANFHSANYAFDAEDFHRGETNNIQRQNRIKLLEDEYLPACSYVSTASPLATEIYKRLYSELNIFTINNVFPFNNNTIDLEIPTKPIKLVWFSQTIGLNRGLQQFLERINTLDPKNYELHLRGSHTAEIKESLLALLSKEWRSSLFFYQQCSSTYLENWLSDFDIGLALENKETLNREICISNKIFQYISAGLAIIATDTEGQKWVLNQAPEIGLIVEQNKMEVAANHINYWAEHLHELELAKRAALNIAQSKFNWDLEKNKLLQQISTI